MDDAEALIRARQRAWRLHMAHRRLIFAKIFWVVVAGGIGWCLGSKGRGKGAGEATTATATATQGGEGMMKGGRWRGGGGRWGGGAAGEGGDHLHDWGQRCRRAWEARHSS